MPKYMVNVDVGFRPNEHGPALLAGTEFESDETPEIAALVKRGHLEVVKRRAKSSDEPVKTLDELTSPEPVIAPGDESITTIDNSPTAEEVPAAPTPKKARSRAKKK